MSRVNSTSLTIEEPKPQSSASVIAYWVFVGIAVFSFAFSMYYWNQASKADGTESQKNSAIIAASIAAVSFLVTLFVKPCNVQQVTLEKGSALLSGIPQMTRAGGAYLGDSYNSISGGL